MLANLITSQLDEDINNFLQSIDLDFNYSRYADDITFSGTDEIVGIINLSKKIINEEEFIVNDKKTRIAYSHQKQEVTGLIVNNETVRVDKRYKRKLYQELYYCEKYGVADHMQRINCNKAFFKEHLYGKAYFVNMVEPDEGKKLFEILNRIQWDY